MCLSVCGDWNEGVIPRSLAPEVLILNVSKELSTEKVFHILFTKCVVKWVLSTNNFWCCLISFSIQRDHIFSYNKDLKYMFEYFQKKKEK